MSRIMLNEGMGNGTVTYTAEECCVVCGLGAH